MAGISNKQKKSLGRLQQEEDWVLKAIVWKCNVKTAVDKVSYPFHRSLTKTESKSENK